MFEKAARLKLRWVYKGLCSIEDLWDLPVEALDSIFKKLNAEMKEQKEESLLDDPVEGSTVLSLQIEIVKHIVKVKIQERDDRENSLAKAEKKKKLLAILANKEDESLKEMSVDDLKSMIEKL